MVQQKQAPAEQKQEPADGVDEQELFEAPERGSAEELLDAQAGDPLDPMRHSAAHVMAEAVMDLFPGTKLGIGPAIKDGFYYDFDLPRPLTPDDLEKIEQRMAASVKADNRFVRKELPFAEGRRFFEEHGQPYKVEILDDLASKDGHAKRPLTLAAAFAEPPDVSTYEHGDFIDLCRGPHVESTGRIGPFKLLSVAGAYWRGKEDRPMLQRIYGTVWPTQEELDKYLWRRSEAKKRDHRRLGRELDLFSFHDVSPGAAFWHPKGQRMWRTLESAMRDLQKRRGYDEVGTPIMVHKKLWQQSGHWDLYEENMFRLTVEEQEYGLKPMNCPESTFIYNSRVRSYREFPIRYAEYGRLHRNERSGTLSGLTRLRHFVQDDAHIYVRADQIQSEINEQLDIVRETYSWFGLEPRFVFATKPDKAVGDPGLWERAESQMREALERSKVSYTVKPKDGTFYAPKIDIYIEDALGREWQMATIQVDLTMLPERFDLVYADAEGKRQRPAVIHRAIYGSIERFIGILTEHFAGAFPYWVAPVQVAVIPIAERHNAAARELAGLLDGRGIRVEVDDSDGRMQNKIRLAQEQKVPYMLVLGDREVEVKSATVRRRDAKAGDAQESLGWEDLADRLTSEAAARRPV
jgi:threonyl-tRNA synthetase